MSEILRLTCAEWEFSVRSKDVFSRQKLFNKISKRYTNNPISAHIKLSKKLNCDLLEILSTGENRLTQISDAKDLNLLNPYFYENTNYHFEFVFFDPKVTDVSIKHKLKKISEAFYFIKPRNNNETPRLIGNFNTGNDIGWFKLPLSYLGPNDNYSFISISFQVFPLKMDIENDLVNMYKSLDKHYPLWRFSLANKTDQSASKGDSLGYFPLLWIANFESVKDNFIQSLNTIVKFPHKKLIKFSSNVTADKLKGKITNLQVDKIKEDFNNGLFHKKYRFERKFLSHDTPENRFIKMIAGTTRSRLSDFHNRLINLNTPPENQLLTNEFINQIYQWQEPFSRLLNNPFFNGVGEYQGLKEISLVFQNKKGYISAYKIWQDLKFYLDLFANQSSISLKSIEEIYEVWCFLELRRIILDKLGFKEILSESNNLMYKDLEYKLRDGIRGAFHFTRIDGLEIRLAHEPIFKSDTKNIRTYWVTQKPDIFMEIKYPDSKKIIFIFDAKYRISTDDEIQDFVPEDALNQMHRYRDALISVNDKLSHSSIKSRPIFNALALYPGFYDQTSTNNPYDTLIKETGVGAFPLLPSTDVHNGSFWLENYLYQHLGDSFANIKNSQSELFFIKEPSRIPFSGMNQKLYSDLVLLINLDSSKSYEKSIIITESCVYISSSILNKKFENHMVSEIMFISFNNFDPGSFSCIGSLFNAHHVKNICKKELSSEITSNIHESYWTFELGSTLKINDLHLNLLLNDLNQTFKLTTLTKIHECNNNYLKYVYENFN